MGIPDRERDAEFRALYERHGSLVHARCRSILKSEDEAWDATQDVFMKLFHSLSSIKKMESVYSWLLSASTNHCISLLRKRRTSSFDEEIHSAGSGQTVPHQERELLLKEVLTRFFAPWDRVTREVVMYAYFDGYRQDEIAALMGIGESTVRKHLTRFKRKSAASGLKFEEVSYG
jgi:RNA polymerase sigma-70 factor (ECF subfamily)